MTASPDIPVPLAQPGDHPEGFNQNVPNSARIYDWLLGGKDHYAADREAGQKLVTAVPGAPQAARDNRAFLSRAVRYLAGQGITQYIVIGSGLPAAGPVHHLAREYCLDPHVAYVDHNRCKSGCAHAC